MGGCKTDRTFLVFQLEPQLFVLPPCLQRIVGVIGLRPLLPPDGLKFRFSELSVQRRTAEIIPVLALLGFDGLPKFIGSCLAVFDEFAPCLANVCPAAQCAFSNGIFSLFRFGIFGFCEIAQRFCDQLSQESNSRVARECKTRHFVFHITGFPGCLLPYYFFCVRPLYPTGMRVYGMKRCTQFRRRRFPDQSVLKIAVWRLDGFNESREIEVKPNGTVFPVGFSNQCAIGEVIKNGLVGSCASFSDKISPDFERGIFQLLRFLANAFRGGFERFPGFRCGKQFEDDCQGISSLWFSSQMRKLQLATQLIQPLRVFIRHCKQPFCPSGS